MLRFSRKLSLKTLQIGGCLSFDGKSNETDDKPISKVIKVIIKKQ